jgi:hypothetical protein
LGNFGKAYYDTFIGRIGLFKGKMITLCARVTNVPMIAHETSTEEEFEVINFIENIEFNLRDRKNYVMLVPHRYLMRTTGKNPHIVS